MADAGSSSITVAVRVRPFTIREAAQISRTDDGNTFLGDGSLAAAPTPKLNQRGIRNVIKVMDERCLVFDPPEDNPVHKFGRSVVPSSKRTKDQVFAFDRVFDEATNQSDVYEGTTKKLLDSVLDGYNATVFAYGATGCGKTHTITGTPAQPGIIFLTMQELFEKIEERSQDKATELSLSYLEIYNETIRDLLDPEGNPPKGGLMLREDSNQAVSVSGLSTHTPKNVQEVMDMIVQGNECRTVSPTAANATSSRSHAVLQVNIAQKDRNADVNEPHTMATLSIIDLAGSERASVTKNRGERLTEGANINKSLLALGGCINALCDRRGRAHIPYRNSKLTRLLKFSLGGNCKTVMIVCVSPSSAHFDETQNTLRYANRAKNIQTKVTRNVFNVNRHVKDYLVKIDEQMNLINELRAQQKDSEKLFFKKFQSQSDKRDSTAREGFQRLRTAYDNCAKEREERIGKMKKLRTFERRIGLLSGWISAFNNVCELKAVDGKVPHNLTAMRKTAQGIMIELENSRYYIHQQLEKPTWEHAIDTALSHSLSQLEGTEGADSGQVASLTREADLLKATFHSQAYREVLEQEKGGDAAIVQVLLNAQFEIICSLSETLAMDEEEAVAHAKEIINRLLQTSLNATHQVIKPDGTLPTIDIHPPTRKGTPKRRASSTVSFKPIAAPNFAGSVQSEQGSASPMKGSPRRRKAVTAAKKGVSFTPVKKPKTRGVRWRDDEDDKATIADFSQTPQKVKSSPTEPIMPQVPAATYLEEVTEEAEASEDNEEIEDPPAPTISCEEEEEEMDTICEMPEVKAAVPSRPGRFSTGFLSKSARLSTVPSDGSGSPVAPSMSLNIGSSPDAGRKSPLRALDVAKTGNLSPSNMRSSIPRTSPKSRSSLDVIMDENTLPISSNKGRRESGSDSESNTMSIDPKKLRAAIFSHSANAKSHPRRTSLMTGTAASHGRRVSSVGSIGSDRHAAGGLRSRPSMPGPLASSTNGISRHRRGSDERHRAPPMHSSMGIGITSADHKSGSGFTPGQARRMNMGGSLRGDQTGTSPSDRSTGHGGPRRVTINVGGPGVHKGGRAQNSTNATVWR